MPADITDLYPVVQRALGVDFSHIRISPLAGGITNLNYHVIVAGNNFVLRVPGKDTNLLGIDRANEVQNQRVASEVGAAPEVVAYIEPEGYTISRFVVGKGIPANAMRELSMLERVCTSLHRFHDGPAFAGEFNPFRVCESYRTLALNHGIRGPSNLDLLFDIAVEIEKVCSNDSPIFTRPCHNDLLNENFIDDGLRIWVLDWEYAGMGDVYFDLANLAGHHQLNDEDERLLLTVYFGRYRAGDHARLKLLRIMSDFREAMWGFVQQGLSTIDFDFSNYAEAFFSRLMSQISDERYKQWLELAARQTIR